MQGKINEYQLREYAQQFDQISERLAARDELNYEVLHNLVLELTRLGIEVKNLKMRVESLSTRLDFDERRARSLESLVQFKPGAGRPGRRTPRRPRPRTRDRRRVRGRRGPAGKRRRRRRGRRRGPG